MRELPYISRDLLQNEQNYKLAEQIIRNVNMRLRMQTVHRTMNSMFWGTKFVECLIAHFVSMDIKVLFYSENTEELKLFSQCLNHEYFCMCSEKTIAKSNAEDFDLFIVDAPLIGFETQFIDDKTKYGAFPNLRTFVKEFYLLNESYIICFENNPSIREWVKYTPIIATSEILTYENRNKIFSEFERSCKTSYAELRKFQLEIELDKRCHAYQHVMDNEHKYGIYQDIEELVYDEELAESIGNISLSMSAIMDKLIFVEEQIFRLSEDVGDLRRKINQVNESLNKNWDILRLYCSISNNGGLDSDLFIKKLIDRSIDEQTQEMEQIKSCSDYAYAESLTKESLGNNAWSKMQDESKRLLVTAKLYLDELCTYGNSIDFSSVCMLASKALEIELSVRFVAEYTSYLRKQGLKKSDFPSGLIVKNHGKNVVLKAEEFTLGNCPYIMGRVGRNELDKERNRNLFTQYCNERLLLDMNMQQTEKWIKKIDSNIRHVKEHFRNPAAHKGIITFDIAEECVGYLFDVDLTCGDLVLTRFLDECRF